MVGTWNKRELIRNTLFCTLCIVFLLLSILPQSVLADTCPTCYGDGTVDRTCTTCGGDGIITQDYSYTEVEENAWISGIINKYVNVDVTVMNNEYSAGTFILQVTAYDDDGNTYTGSKSEAISGGTMKKISVVIQVPGNLFSSSSFRYTASIDPPTKSISCTACGGDGTIDSICTTCGGDGEVSGSTWDDDPYDSYGEDTDWEPILCISGIILVIVIIASVAYAATRKKNTNVPPPPPVQQNASQRYCAGCGRIIPPDSIMCPYCGR
jgi:hypothetical protein